MAKFIKLKCGALLNVDRVLFIEREVNTHIHMTHGEPLKLYTQTPDEILALIGEAE